MLIRPVKDKNGWFAEFECRKCGHKRRLWFFKKEEMEAAKKDESRNDCDWYKENCQQVKKAV
jgi:hypothetical protein